MKKNFFSFDSFGELLGFDFSQLRPSCTNYLVLKPKDGILPVVNKESSFKEWMVVRSDKDTEPKITMEIDPEWLSITVYDGKISRKQDISIRRSKKSPKALIQEIFQS